MRVDLARSQQKQKLLAFLPTEWMVTTFWPVTRSQEEPLSEQEVEMDLFY